MDVIVFGLGEEYESLKSKLKYMNVVGYLDNDTKKQGRYINGKSVDKPKNIQNYDYEYIIIFGKYWKEMRKQLIDLDVPENKILDKEHRGVFEGYIFKRNYMSGKTDSIKKKVAVFSHELTQSGAPIVLRNLAVVLRNNGYSVDFISRNEGGLLLQLIQDGINVIIYNDYEFTENQIIDEFKDYDFFVVNTVVLYQLVLKLKILEKHIIWWLHESNSFYKDISPNMMQLDKIKDIIIYGVSNRVLEAYKNNFKIDNIKCLSYGIEENYNVPSIKKQKIVFALIGCLCELKGADLFYNCVEQNWNIWCSVAEFWVIGTGSDKFVKNYRDNKKFKYYGEIAHNQLIKFMNQVDCIVCPSREDSLPVVMTEGMMLRKICIASDATGTAEYVNPYNNGLLFKSESVNSLAEQIQWVIDNKECLDDIGENAYKLYQKEFSMRSFERKIMEIVKDY